MNIIFCHAIHQILGEIVILTDKADEGFRCDERISLPFAFREFQPESYSRYTDRQ
ncbi:Uncharacterised protein [Pragia fontium]|uniref:Uncharacterized protein n=1 Tax=Pragia fontium DSM 5563 = ATCC 49100 TaxID=1122977 RepID=A0AAJ5BHR9_9GAMM|nr:hypothetical protein SAMN02745723_107126 [Pragia fontium DSM 5563 = ATCC 49100]SUB83355.1 Uncharacterised protein [Pragia fontium]VEJ56251.1 Uncharacterised protein [Pragia fontium]